MERHIIQISFSQENINTENYLKKKILISFSNLKKIHKPRLSKIKEGRVVQAEISEEECESKIAAKTVDFIKIFVS